MRFSEIERYLPKLTSKVLSERLSELQMYGLVNKEGKEVTPLNMRYTLRSDGLSILRAL